MCHPFSASLERVHQQIPLGHEIGPAVGKSHPQQQYQFRTKPVAKEAVAVQLGLFRHGFLLKASRRDLKTQLFYLAVEEGNDATCLHAPGRDPVHIRHVVARCNRGRMRGLHSMGSGVGNIRPGNMVTHDLSRAPAFVGI